MSDVVFAEATGDCDIVDEVDVERLLAAGELVPIPSWGDPPVREDVVAALRRQVLVLWKKKPNKKP